MRADAIRRAAEVLGGTAAFPTVDGEPLFAEPWEGRAFALALQLLERTGLPWEAFRSRLVAAIDADPHRPYYESWLLALEALALDVDAVAPDALARQRAAAASYRYHDAELGDVEVVPVRMDELPGVLSTFAPDGRVELTAVLHAEHYRRVDGPWRFRLFDAADVVVLDVARPPEHRGASE